MKTWAASTVPWLQNVASECLLAAGDQERHCKLGGELGKYYRLSCFNLNFKVTKR